MAIELTNLCKWFGGFHAVDNVNFSINEGELVGLLGPSGGGKSTILRMIAGLESPSSGEIYINGERADNCPPQARGIGMVFQHYALFKHMTVFDNIAFGLQIKKVPRIQITERVGELISLMGLDGLSDRKPHQLSGGQRQRVALARALAPEPKVLLLDEPFGAVDAKIRRELRKWLRELHDKVGITSLFVTHDQEEALEVADRIIIVNKGQIEQMGTPKEIYEGPASEFVANFIGPVNILPAEIIRGKAQVGPFSLQAPGFKDGELVKLVLRPSDIRLETKSSLKDGHGLIKRMIFMGEQTKIDIEMDKGQKLVVQLPRGHQNLEGLGVGKRINLEVSGGRIFPSDFLQINKTVS